MSKKEPNSPAEITYAAPDDDGNIVFCAVGSKAHKDLLKKVESKKDNDAGKTDDLPRPTAKRSAPAKSAEQS
ncbi:hypothetical protein WG936_05475 [Corynebacterium sp. H127]|uniref:hypothetical protein n=1 Tax=Corynebacterium sp. H127 TaxID=3133418 RepID=UPI003095B38B